jgi:hypothetical protein
MMRSIFPGDSLPFRLADSVERFRVRRRAEPDASGGTVGVVDPQALMGPILGRLEPKPEGLASAMHEAIRLLAHDDPELARPTCFVHGNFPQSLLASQHSDAGFGLTRIEVPKPRIGHFDAHQPPAMLPAELVGKFSPLGWRNYCGKHCLFPQIEGRTCFTP